MINCGKMHSITMGNAWGKSAILQYLATFLERVSHTSCSEKTLLNQGKRCGRLRDNVLTYDFPLFRPSNIVTGIIKGQHSQHNTAGSSINNKRAIYPEQRGQGENWLKRGVNCISVLSGIIANADSLEKFKSFAEGASALSSPRRSGD